MGGGPQQLEQGLEAAEETVRLATEHMSHIPQPLQPNITGAVMAALATIQATTAFGSSTVRDALANLPYGIAHDTMQVFASEDEARDHTDREMRYIESHRLPDRRSDEELETSAAGFETSLRQDRRELARLERIPNPDRGEIRRLDISIQTTELELRRIHYELERRSGVDVPEVFDEDVQVARQAGTTALGWMTASYLGADLHAVVSSAPPILTVESERFFDSLDALEGHYGSTARYFPGTNHIAVRSVQDDIVKDALEATVAHEMLHYIAYLGGGHHIRWTSDSGELVDQGNITWLHEGLTELHAQQLTSAHGIHPDASTYEHETRTAFYLQRIVGEPVLRRAYLTGDFSEVRTRLNARLGEGTFETLAKQREYVPDPRQPGATGYVTRGSDAVAFLLDRMDAAGVDRSTWDQDPLIADSVRVERLIEGGADGSS